MKSETDISVEKWTTEDVFSWLNSKGFCDYATRLTQDHHIDGVALLMLTESDLRSPPLSIQVLGDIKHLAKEIANLHRKQRYRTGCPRTYPAFCSDESSENENDGLSSGDIKRKKNKLYYSSVPSTMSPKNGRTLDPEKWKTVIAVLYVLIVCGVTSGVMVVVHDSVPDMQTHPPLPDIFLDNVPLIPWAFATAEVCGLVLALIWGVVLIFHKHRWIVLRRMCALAGTVFLLRCVCMFVTSLSVPGTHLKCSAKLYHGGWTKLRRALEIWIGFGMTLTGVHTCGDYMFSGHTALLTLLNFFITEYTPRSWVWLHTASWVLNLFVGRHGCDNLANNVTVWGFPTPDLKRRLLSTMETFLFPSHTLKMSINRIDNKAGYL
uniref:Sphingomyelin synthase-related protein 1 n=1 Tax=Eptatretus burgeri TaxID=7764 RepID=A0A8C4NGD6_EPTBU